MSDYNLVTTDSLIAKIEDQLSSYSLNGLLDTGKFYAEIKLVINQLGIAAYELINAIVTLEDHKAALPCNFYLLDSAWLCDSTPEFNTPIQQSYFSVYTETSTELICRKSCGNSNFSTLEVNPCTNNNEQILDKITIKEYVNPGTPLYNRVYKNPIMLRLRNKKSLSGDICSKSCKNIFAKSVDEISITNKGGNKYLTSTLKNPVIYIKYYAFPEDPETGLPLIPEEPIIQRAIEFHLMHYFFYMAWLDSSDSNIERKVKDLEMKRDLYIAEAKNHSKMPSFNKSVEMTRNARRKWAAYELLNTRHY